MATVTVEWKGDKELTRKLNRLSDAAQSRILNQVAAAGAFVVEGYAKLEALVDTGFMRNSIYTKTAEISGYVMAADRAAQAINTASDTGGRNYGERRMLPEGARPPTGTAVVAVGAEYGVHVEYLYKAFMTPAADNHRDEIYQAMNVTFQREVEAAWR
jgi:hypothetical protein